METNADHHTSVRSETCTAATTVPSLMCSTLCRKLVSFSTKFFKPVQVGNNWICNHNFQICWTPSSWQVRWLCRKLHSATIFFQQVFHFFKTLFFDFLTFQILGWQFALSLKWCLVHPACFLQIVQNTLLHWLIVPGFFNCFVRSCLFCIHSVCHSAAWPPCHLWTAPSLHLNFPGCFNLLLLYLLKIQEKYNVYLVSCQYLFSNF